MQKHTKAPRGVTGEYRRQFLALTAEQQEVFLYYFHKCGRLTAHCLMLATGEMVERQRPVRGEVKADAPETPAETIGRLMAEVDRLRTEKLAIKREALRAGVELTSV